MDKRKFLKQISLLGLTASPAIAHFEKLMTSVSHMESNELASDEDFWGKIRGTYKLKPDYINLENGYYCFMPEDTL